MLVNPADVAPSQNFLKENTVRFILECLRNSDYDSLPPSPILREDEDGKLIAIDGHNLLAVMAHVGQSQDVHVAMSAEDGLPETSEANITRNEDLRTKFESSLAERARVSDEGIESFNDLIAKYPELFEGE